MAGDNGFSSELQLCPVYSMIIVEMYHAFDAFFYIPLFS